MAEVMKPIEVSDLNGVSLNPQDLSVDQLVGFTGYIRGLVSTLGTEADSPEGYKDYLNFQKEIEAARISTFEPDMIDDDHTFENVDLTGDDEPVPEIPATYYAMINGMMWLVSQMNNNKGVTPFDYSVNKEAYAPMSGPGLTPFDLIGNRSLEPVGPSLAN
jgi:hypothetical protein